MISVLVTGTEKSGSTFVAQAIARSLNIDGAEEWNGTHRIRGSRDGIVIHRSLPAGIDPPVYYHPGPLMQKEGGHNEIRKYVITIRDINISHLSRNKTWDKSIEQARQESVIARQYITDLLRFESLSNIFLFSYESAMYLDCVYFDLLYHFLGIDLFDRYYPELIDGNVPYIKLP